MKRAAVLVLCLLASGCGFGPAEVQSGGSVTVTVSQDFGETRMAPTSRQQAREGETVMRLLQRTFDVKTRFGGNFVQEIDGVSGGREEGRRVDWFYYVNGIESSEGAGERRLYPGDRIWWDHHDWEGAMRVPAVVGSFPEPFRSGRVGQEAADQARLPRPRGPLVRRGRDAPARRRRAQRRPLEPRVLASARCCGSSSGAGRTLRQDIAARQLEEGPEVSGVFAKPNAAGSEIELIDAEGDVERTLGPASGLVAATGYQEYPPTWLITGTDDVGVAAAAATLTEDGLRYHFALAIEAGKGVPLPVETP